MILKSIGLGLLILISSTSANAITFKVGVLAPENTSWSKHLKKMAKEIKKISKGKVKFRIYFNGAQGDEDEVLRKVRIGQLDGGVFSGKTLGELNGDVRAMELPFTFLNDTELARKALRKMTPFFNKKLMSGKGRDRFHNLGMFEVGPVYFVSQKETKSLKELKGLKIWSWKGDPLVKAMIESMKLVSVPLSLPDVLSSLSTGIVEAAYAPPMAILALQWHTKTKYVVDFPLSYSVGALLLSESKWKKIDPALKKKITAISDRYMEMVTVSNGRDNIQAKDILKTQGRVFIKFSQEDIKQAGRIRADVIKALKGPVISPEAMNLLEKTLKELRAEGKKSTKAVSLKSKSASPLES